MPEGVDLIIFLLAGILTGIVNTIAGSGTIFSIGTMVFMGMPIEIANITNRLGVFFQNISGSLTYRKFDNLNHIRLPYPAMIATLIGAVTGAYFAANVSSSIFEIIALIVMLYLIIQTVMDIRNSKWEKGEIVTSNSKILKSIIFFSIGFYGGFIQIGVGILLLLGIRRFLKHSWIESNYLKLIIVLIYTIPTTLYFAWVGMIEWRAGSILAIGQIIGAYAAARTFTVNKKLKKLIPYFVLFMLVITSSRIILN